MGSFNFGTAVAKARPSLQGRRTTSGNSNGAKIPTYHLGEYLSPYDAISRELHNVNIFRGASAPLEMRLRLIESAESNIDIELNQLGEDEVSRTLLIALLKKANSMTRVYFKDNNNNYRWAFQNPKTKRPFSIRVLVNEERTRLNPYVVQLLKDTGIRFRTFNSKKDLSNPAGSTVLSNDKMGSAPSIRRMTSDSYQDHRALFLSDEKVLLSEDDLGSSFSELAIPLTNGSEGRTFLVEGAISFAARKSFLQYFGLEDSPYGGFYSVDPKLELQPNQIASARAFLEMDGIDRAFRDKIFKFRTQANASIQNRRFFISKKVHFLSDVPGSQDENRRVTPNSLLSNDGICLTTMKIPRPSMGFLSEIAICIEPVKGPPVDVQPPKDNLAAVLKSIPTTTSLTPMNPKCVKDKKDPFDPGMVVLVGSIAGKNVCGDTNEIRAPVILKSELPDVIKIANFRYARQWWIASIPLKAISAVYIQTPLFKPLPNLLGPLMKIADVAHAQFRFQLNPKIPLALSRIKLEPQSGNQIKRESPIYLDDFLADFQPFQSLDDSGTVTIATRIISNVDRGVESIALNFHERVEQMELKMTREQRIRLALTSILRGQREGYKNEYDGLKNNCAVVALATFDEAFPPSKNVPDVDVGVTTVLNPVIKPLKRAFIARGFIDDNSANYSMNDEIGDGGLGFVEEIRNNESDLKERDFFNKNLRSVPGLSK